MNRKKLAVALAVVVVACIALYALWDRGRDRDQPLTLYGNVDIREVELGFRQSGRLASLSVDEGDAVEAGQVLAMLDSEPFEEALAAAQAQVAEAEAELDKQLSGNRSQDIGRAQASRDEAEAVLREAESHFVRQSRLLDSGATSQRSVDSARAARDQARALLDAAGQALDLQREGARREDIAAAQARLATARASLAQAETALADTRLTAPEAASVLTRAREPGSMLSQGEAVYTLSLRDPVYVRAYVAEPDLGRLPAGAAVEVLTDSSDKVYRGQVGFVSPRAEFTPKSVETTDLRTDLVYRLRIVIADADEGLRQGMPVTVQLAGPQPGA